MNHSDHFESGNLIASIDERELERRLSEIEAKSCKTGIDVLALLVGRACLYGDIEWQAIATPQPNLPSDSLS